VAGAHRAPGMAGGSAAPGRRAHGGRDRSRVASLGHSGRGRMLVAGVRAGGGVANGWGAGRGRWRTGFPSRFRRL